MNSRTLLFVLAMTATFLVVRFTFDYFEPPQPIPTHKAAAATPKPEIQKPKAEPQPVSQTQKQARYYVLETPYQQIVFSSIGGAIAEINLPFRNPEDKKSVVLPTEFDRLLAKEQPGSSRFPLHEALGPDGTILPSVVGGYYPLLRRDTRTMKMAPQYLSCNIVSEYPEVAELNYEVKKFTSSEIVFEAHQAHRHITKRFFFDGDPDLTPYCFSLELKIDGDVRGLALSSGIPEVEWISGSSGAILKYHIFQGKSSKVQKIDLPKDTFSMTSIVPDWICNSNGFFGIILDPIAGAEAGFRVTCVPGAAAPSRLYDIDRSSDRFPLSSLPGYDVSLNIKEANELLRFRFFAGPFAESVLKKADAYYAAQHGGRDSDYLSCQTYHGWFAFISEPFAKFLFLCMKFFYAFCGSWGLSIIFVTCVLRLLLYPLNAWSFRSAKRMQLIAPKMKAIQERQKKDPQKAQKEMLDLYREYKVNPFTGCLPMLIQMPFLIGMFDLLKSSFELRGAPFIPGWINDLSAPDTLFSWGFSIPFIGNEFHLLPVLLGGIMYIQQNLMANLPKDPAEWTDQQRQQRTMGNVMTIVMTVMFYQFPSGLNIYWISSMALGIVQQWWNSRNITLVRAAVSAEKGNFRKK
jgi:YidC/Oxa1 family membrane protein insertase